MSIVAKYRVYEMRYFIWILVIGCGLFFLTKDYFITHTWRYKITVEIETPDGIKSGSAVREVRARRNLVGALPQANEVLYDVIGEAVVVDLKDDGTVFGLIDWDSYQDFYGAFQHVDPHQSDNQMPEVHDTLVLGSKGELTGKKPRFLYFPNFKNLEDVVVVKFGEDFQAKNYILKIKNISIELTDQELTNEILPWVELIFDQGDFVRWRHTLKYGDLRAFTKDNFKRGY